MRLGLGLAFIPLISLPKNIRGRFHLTNLKKNIVSDAFLFVDNKRIIYDLVIIFF